MQKCVVQALSLSSICQNGSSARPMIIGRGTLGGARHQLYRISTVDTPPSAVGERCFTSADPQAKLASWPIPKSRAPGRSRRFSEVASQ